MIFLDTCVISECLKQDASPRVEAWLERLDEKRVFLSTLVLGELLKGAALLDPGSKKNTLLFWLEQLKERFTGRLIPFDEDAAQAWAALNAQTQRRGRALPLMDSLIAAQVLSRSGILATRNAADFEGTGVLVVNPWE